MTLFRNLGVNQPKADKSSRGGQVCGIACATYQMYASAQSLDFLDLANPATAGLDWQLKRVPITKRAMYG